MRSKRFFNDANRNSSPTHCEKSLLESSDDSASQMGMKAASHIAMQLLYNSMLRRSSDGGHGICALTGKLKYSIAGFILITD